MLKHNMHVKYQHEFQVMRGHFDAALVALYAVHKKSNLGLELFYLLHKPMCDSLFRAADMAAVLAATGRWTQVKDEVLRITGSSQLGARMLAFAKLQVQSAAVGEIIFIHFTFFVLRFLLGVLQKACTVSSGARVSTTRRRS